MENKEIKLLIRVLVLILLPFVTTLLLDWPWVQGRTVRQILVYCLIAFEVFVLVTDIFTVAKEKE